MDLGSLVVTLVLVFVGALFLSVLGFDALLACWPERRGGRPARRSESGVRVSRGPEA